MKVAFLGRKQVAAECLNWLLQRPDVQVAAVVTDAAAGGAAVAGLAHDARVPMLSHQEIHAGFDSGEIDAELVISVLYPRRLTGRILEAPALGAINFHPAPLPAYKGTAGYNLAILEGLAEWAVSAHYMVEAIDAGQIIDVASFPIDPVTATVRDIEALSCAAIHRQFIDVLEKILQRMDRLPGRPNEGGRYVSRREMEAMKEILPGDDVPRKIRAFWYPPYRGAWVRIDGQQYTVLSDELLARLAD